MFINQWLPILVQLEVIFLHRCGVSLPASSWSLPFELPGSPAGLWGAGCHPGHPHTALPVLEGRLKLVQCRMASWWDSPLPHQQAQGGLRGSPTPPRGPRLRKTTSAPPSIRCLLLLPCTQRWGGHSGHMQPAITVCLLPWNGAVNSLPWSSEALRGLLIAYANGRASTLLV